MAQGPSKWSAAALANSRDDERDHAARPSLGLFEPCAIDREDRARRWLASAGYVEIGLPFAAVDAIGEPLPRLDAARANHDALTEKRDREIFFRNWL